MAKKTKTTRSTRPTSMAYGSLDLAHAHFNRELFGGTLSPCMITLRAASRSYGYYHGDRFTRAHGGGKAGKAVDEIAMNPSHMADRSPTDILSTLAHEMAHQWQKEHGDEPTRCYHDRQWAAKMKEIGLHPSNTGVPGGKETGSQMTHYIIEQGLFARSCAKFLKSHKAALYQDQKAALEIVRIRTRKTKDPTEGGGEGSEPAEPKSTGRAKFTCLGCDLNAWARPGANLRCGDCNRPMHKPEDDDDGED